MVENAVDTDHAKEAAPAFFNDDGMAMVLVNQVKRFHQAGFRIKQRNVFGDEVVGNRLLPALAQAAAQFFDRRLHKIQLRQFLAARRIGGNAARQKQLNQAHTAENADKIPRIVHYRKIAHPAVVNDLKRLGDGHRRMQRQRMVNHDVPTGVIHKAPICEC